MIINFKTSDKNTRLDPTPDTINFIREVFS